MKRLLLVEDDQNLATGLEYNLRRAGYEVEIVDNGRTAVERVRKDPPDLMVLDLMLPEKSGFEVLEEISGQDVPVLILSAKDAEVDKIRGFDLGAVDYVTKPFSLGELLARIRVRLTERSTAEVERFALGEGHVDLSRFCFESQRGTVALTQTEVELLRVLHRRAGQLVSREDLMRSVWNLGPRSSRSLDTHVARLRKKLEENPAQPRFLRTVHGVGYCLMV